MHTIRTIIFFLTSAFFYSHGYAQLQHHPYGHLPIGKVMGYGGWSIEEKTARSEIVVEGTGISSYWNAGFFDSNGILFSSYLIRISKVFKGVIKDSVIEIITEGGVVPSGPNKGDQIETLWCNPAAGTEGTFFLMPNTTNIQSGKGYQSFLFIDYCSMFVYQHPAGYNDYTPITTNGSRLIWDLTSELYPSITAAANQPYKVLGPISFDTIKTSKIDPKTYKGDIPLSDKVSSLTHISLDDKIKNSDLIVEGEVVSTHVLKGSKNAYTAAIIRVSKLFKGEIKDTIIEVVTDGAIMPNGRPLRSLWGLLLKGQRGIFFLRPNNLPLLQSGENIQSYFFLYDYSFMIYTFKSLDYEVNIYHPIEAVTAQKYIDIHPGH